MLGSSRRPGLGVTASFVFACSLALAAPASAAGRKAAKAAQEPEPSGPPPSLTVTVKPARVGELWWLQVGNVGDTPVRVLADARLLAFDVTPPGATEPFRCALPAGMRPSSENGRALVLPPQHAYEERFDPRLFCFGAKAGDALVPGASVVPLYGFPPPPPKTVKGKKVPAKAPPKKPVKEKAPFVARGAEPSASLTPAKVVTGATVTVPEGAAPEDPDLKAPRPVEARSADTEASASRYSLTTPRWVDAYDDNALYVSVGLKNESPTTTPSRLRPASIGVRVLTPGGQLVTCPPVGAPAPPIRELVSYVRPGGRLSQSLLLSARCPSHAFDAAGLYAARAYVESSHVTAAAPAPGHADGIVEGPTFLLRVHHGTTPSEVAPLRAVPINR